MIWSISWRNVWRNKLRSGIVITAITLGVFAGVFSIAFMRGMADQRLASAIRSEVSHIQIHLPDFMDVKKIENYMKNTDEIASEIREKDAVVNASRRIIINSMVMTTDGGSGIKIIGVEPEHESEVTNIKESIRKGEYFEDYKRSKSVVIGDDLAEKHDFEVGDRFIVTLVDAQGTQIPYRFKISGIYGTTNSNFDEMNAFVRFKDLQEIANLPEGAGHEIAIYLKNNEISKQLASELSEEYPNLDIKQWFELLPELKYLTETMDFMMYIFIIIILLALGFGIVNTMLMVVLERIKELGMLMAVGMNKMRLFGMIMLETVFLSFTGGVAGILLGYSVSKIFEYRGIDLSSLYGEGLEAIGYNSLVYTEIQFENILIVAILVILTGMIASIYPARKAMKLNPADAIRTDA